MEYIATLEQLPAVQDPNRNGTVGIARPLAVHCGVEGKSVVPFSSQPNPSCAEIVESFSGLDPVPVRRQVRRVGQAAGTAHCISVRCEAIAAASALQSRVAFSPLARTALSSAWAASRSARKVGSAWSRATVYAPI